MQHARAKMEVMAQDEGDSHSPVLKRMKRRKRGLRAGHRAARSQRPAALLPARNLHAPPANVKQGTAPRKMQRRMQHRRMPLPRRASTAHSPLLQMVQKPLPMLRLMVHPGKKAGGRLRVGTVRRAVALRRQRSPTQRRASRPVRQQHL